MEALPTLGMQQQAVKTTDTATGLAAGTYTVTVTDVKGALKIHSNSRTAEYFSY